jgi:hypothetical protein
MRRSRHQVRSWRQEGWHRRCELRRRRTRRFQRCERPCGQVGQSLTSVKPSNLQSVIIKLCVDNVRAVGLRNGAFVATHASVRRNQAAGSGWNATGLASRSVGMTGHLSWTAVRQAGTAASEAGVLDGIRIGQASSSAIGQASGLSEATALIGGLACASQYHTGLEIVAGAGGSRT